MVRSIRELEVPMDVVTISPKYQVVIPRSVRERLQLEPGQKVQAIVYGDRVELIPIRTAQSLRGFVRGIDTGVDRDADRE
jgi:AbrB family looped-hinge helix DNA binding protein